MKLAIGTVIVLAIVAVITGTLLVDVPRNFAYCEGPDIDVESCRGGRLHMAIFGSVVAGAGLVAIAVIVAAFISRPTATTPSAIEPAREDGASRPE